MPNSGNLNALLVENLIVRGSDGFVLDIPRLSIERGSTVAIIGANGSGKTSLLEAVLGLRKSEGFVSFSGMDLNESVRRELGVYLQSANFEQSMLVREVIALHRSMYKHKEPTLHESLNIADLENKTFQHCSTGQRQRLGIFLGLVGLPSLAMLDEPTSALDAQASAAFRRYISTTDWRETGRTCVLVTHNDADARLADRVIWLDRGKVAGDGSLDALVAAHLGPRHLKLANLDQEKYLIIKKQIPDGLVTRETHTGEQHSIHFFGHTQFEKDFLAIIQGLGSFNYTAAETGAEDIILFGMREAVQ